MVSKWIFVVTLRDNVTIEQIHDRFFTEATKRSNRPVSMDAITSF